MKAKLRLVFGLLTCAIMALLLQPSHARADVNDFTVTSFDADYSLTNEDPQGTLHVIEKISVVFTDNNHGLIRAIPKKYKNQSLKLHINKITSDTQAPTGYSTTTQNDNLIVRIGDPSRTVTGSQEYTIDYTLQNVMTFYQDHDELYWDINGDQWNQPFINAQATIHLPKDLVLTDTRCYQGAYGSTSQDCSISRAKNESLKDVIVATRHELGPQQTLTAVLAFKKGYFNPVTTTEWINEHLAMLLGTILPPLVVGVWAFRRWWKYGKDVKGRGVIVPEYEPPDNLLPAEAGTIISYKTDPKYISATIIDLAIKKHLVIIERKEKKLFKDKTIFIFKRLPSNPSQLSGYEQQILTGIFESRPAGTEVELDTLKNKFYATVTKVNKDILLQLTAKKYFPANPANAGKYQRVLGGLLCVMALLLHSWASIGLFVAAVISFGLSALMPNRTPKGVVARDAIEGLKL